MIGRYLITVSCLVSATAMADWRIDDNVLAHRLYADGRYSEAAEIFTDPAWKGLSLYRSEQWWRAAEAFVRADDALSAHNLGNSYVKLGYYALALEAYQRALSQQSDLQAAQHNAELMRSLLSADDEDQQASGRRDQDKEIDTLENDREEESPTGGAGGEQDATSESNASGEAGSPNDAKPPNSGNDGDSDGGANTLSDDADGQAETGDSVAGQATQPTDASAVTGNSEAEQVTTEGDVVGQRAQLESEQATEQWLNQISHDPARYLQKQIALEMRRRQAQGQAAPAGGDGW